MPRVKTRLLVELATAAVIVGILVFLLIPAFLRSYDRAQAAPCLTNSRQIILALQLYLQDYDARYPTMNMEAARVVEDYWGEGYGGHWTNYGIKRRDYHRAFSIGATLLPYTRAPSVSEEKMWRIWVCPSDGGASSRWALGKRWSSYHYRHYLSIGFAEGYRRIPGIDGKVWAEHEFQTPAQTYVFSELWPWHAEKRASLPWLRGQQGWAPDARIHLTFMDGHTKAMPVDGCVLRSGAWAEQGYDLHWPRLSNMQDCD